MKKIVSVLSAVTLTLSLPVGYAIAVDNNELQTEMPVFDHEGDDEYEFEVQSKKITIPEKPEGAIEKGVNIKVSGVPLSGVGGFVGYGSRLDDWTNVKWSVQLGGYDGTGEVSADLTNMPDTYTECYVKVIGATIDSEKGQVDVHCKIESCEFYYILSNGNIYVKGDTNCDMQVDMSDAVLIMQALANPNKYGENGTAEVHLTAQGKVNKDMDGDGLTVGDAQAIQNKLLGID